MFDKIITTNTTETNDDSHIIELLDGLLSVNEEILIRLEEIEEKLEKEVKDVR